MLASVAWLRISWRTCSSHSLNLGSTQAKKSLKAGLTDMSAYVKKVDGFVRQS
jgi:hypothetical protein